MCSCAVIRFDRNLYSRMSPMAIRINGALEPQPIHSSEQFDSIDVVEISGEGEGGGGGGIVSKTFLYVERRINIFSSFAYDSAFSLS